MLRLESVSESNAVRMLEAASSALGGGPPGGGPPGGGPFGPFGPCDCMSEEIAVVSSSALSVPLLSVSIALNALATLVESRPAAEKAAVISSALTSPSPFVSRPLTRSDATSEALGGASICIDIIADMVWPDIFGAEDAPLVLQLWLSAPEIGRAHV